MRVWKERETNVLNYYWFNKEHEKMECCDLSEMRGIGINGDGLFTREDTLKFIQFASNEICTLFSYGDSGNYKCYLMCRRILSDKKSKVQNYKKLWKHIKEEWDFSKFKLGSEVRIEDSDKVYYFGIAQTNLDSIATAIELVSLRPSRFAIFISRHENNLTEVMTEKLFHIAYKDCRNTYNVNDYGLCTYLCQKGDVAVRWGDGSIDAEIDLIYNPNLIIL